MFLESNRKIGVEKLIPIVKLFLMSIRDIFEMLNSRIQGKGILFVHCSGHSAGVASVASCDRTLRIQSEDLPLTVKAKKNCRSVIAKLFEGNPLWLFLSLISRVLWDWYTDATVQWRSKLVFVQFLNYLICLFHLITSQLTVKAASASKYREYIYPEL